MADIVGSVLRLISPRAAYEREVWSMAYDALREERSAYAAAGRGRLLADWNPGAGSPDAALATDLGTLRRRHRQMYRDNPLFRSAVVNLLGYLIGDGIEIRPVHRNSDVARRALEIWREAAMAPAWGDGQDFYGAQVLRAAEMIKGGESVTVWMPDDEVADAWQMILPGDFIDSTKNELLDDGGRIVMGVEYDKRGRRRALWLYETHPGDLLAPLNLKSVRVPIDRVGHMYWRTDAGQSRGAPWGHAGLVRLHHAEETAEAIRVKKRVESCLALLVHRGASDRESSIGPVRKGADGRRFEELRPGMVAYTDEGESVTVVNPSSSGEADTFYKAQTREWCVSIGVPYHIVTGDVADANYSSLRADIVPFHKRLDLWQHHVLAPELVSDFLRVMRREALRRGDLELLNVRGEPVMPERPWVDPLKDQLALEMEVRGGWESMPNSLAQRGRDWREVQDEQAEWNQEADAKGLVFDTDPRRVNGSGGLQPAVGYLAPRSAEEMRRLAYQILGED